MIESGYPRNDLLYAENRDEYVANVRSSIGIPRDKKVILYAPTWRDDEYLQVGQYTFSLKLDLYEMQEALGDKYVVLLRMHYLIADQLETSGLEGMLALFKLQ